MRDPSGRLGPIRYLPLALAVGLLVAFGSLQLLSFHAGPADALTYLAAGERLNVGHPLYALSPGDRPVEIKPPYWTVPLLSPPTIGVLWRPLALIGDNAVLGWWALCVVATLAVLWLVVRARPVFGAAVVLVFLIPLVFALPAGNVNSLLVAGVAALWLFRDRHWLPGTILALMVSVKVTPIVLAWWFVVRRRWDVLVAAALAGAALAVLTLLGGGVQSVTDYLHVIVSTSAAGTSPFSVAGLLRVVGVPPDVARFAPPLIVAIGFAAMFQARRRPDVAFSIGVFVMVFGSPVVNLDWLELLLAALIPAVVSARRDPAIAQPAARVKIAPSASS